MLSMLMDHAGLLLFPQLEFLRVAGRLAFPIFAYMIAEGCRYTRSRGRYLGMIALLAAVCQIVYYIFDGTLYFSVLATFCLAILSIYALDAWKAAPKVGTTVVLFGTLMAVYVLNRIFIIDYGFWGCMVPFLVSIPDGTKYDRLSIRVGCLGIGLLLLAMSLGGIQYWSLLSLPVLLCYNGKRGKWKMKYFFYIFYPLHLAVLQGMVYFMH